MLDAHAAQISAGLTELSTRMAPDLFLEMANNNIFLDVFVCTLTYFFVLYQPKKLRGGRLMLFRLGAVLPVGYALAGFIGNSIARHGWTEIEIDTLSFLPCRSVAVYMLFVAMIGIRKYQEMEYRERGVTGEALRESLNSDRAARQMSVSLAAAMALISLLEWYLGREEGLQLWGVGSYQWMFLGIPFVLLFDHRRLPKHGWIDAYVPFYTAASYALLAFCSLGWVRTLIDALDAFLLS